MRTLAIAALAAAAWAAAASAQDNAAALKDLAPTGKLRVAIAVSPAPSALYAIKDGSGQYRGVAVDLGTGLAKKLGVPLELVPYLASGEITEAAGQGVWDVTFMPYDAERAKHVDFGAAYHLLQSTYLVAPNSSAQTSGRGGPARHAHRRRCQHGHGAGCRRLAEDRHRRCRQRRR